MSRIRELLQVLWQQVELQEQGDPVSTQAREGEVRRAVHTVGELDEDSVARVLKSAGVESGFVTFDGRRWKAGDFRAEFDGSPAS